MTHVEREILEVAFRESNVRHPKCEELLWLFLAECEKDRAFCLAALYLDAQCQCDKGPRKNWALFAAWSTHLRIELWDECKSRGIKAGDLTKKARRLLFAYKRLERDRDKADKRIVRRNARRRNARLARMGILF